MNKPKLPSLLQATIDRAEAARATGSSAEEFVATLDCIRLLGRAVQQLMKDAERRDMYPSENPILGDDPDTSP